MFHAVHLMIEYVDDVAFVKSSGKEAKVFWEKMSKSKYNGVEPQVGKGSMH
jgi:hypothetical protein